MTGVSIGRRRVPGGLRRRQIGKVIIAGAGSGNISVSCQPEWHGAKSVSKRTKLNVTHSA